MDHLNAPAIQWDEQGLPHSVKFDDKYFCKQNGYEETLHVSCHGNLLEERFVRLDPNRAGTFTIIETGFGTGLSFCAAWKVWEAHAPKSWTLHFVSIELYPISAAEIERALSLWPQLDDYRRQLVEHYKPQPQGVSQTDFPMTNVKLTLVFEHVLEALSQIKRDGIVPFADAWFLNGFAPAKNPEMWSDKVYEGMAALSTKGTTMSTFTVAGFVRRGLEANGFSLIKIKGYGEKKHILTGTFRGANVSL